MGWRRRLGVYARKRAEPDASDTDDGDNITITDDDEAAQAVAAEMTARPFIRALSPEEIEQREFDAIIRELEREDREQRHHEAREQERQQREARHRAEEARRTAQARANAQREARERLAQHTRDRQARDQTEELRRLKQWATAREAADLQHHQEATTAANRQRVVMAYGNVVAAMEQILRPAEHLEPMQPAEPYEGSPRLGDADFNPELWKTARRWW